MSLVSLPDRPAFLREGAFERSGRLRFPKGFVPLRLTVKLQTNLNISFDQGICSRRSIDWTGEAI